MCSQGQSQDHGVFGYKVILKMCVSFSLATFCSCSRSNRVTMKMDVSYTDHSHVIGKGGNTIRRVMAETKCHIHFPDSNRSNPNEKSNQVSIAGIVDYTVDL